MQKLLYDLSSRHGVLTRFIVSIARRIRWSDTPDSQNRERSDRIEAVDDPLGERHDRTFKTCRAAIPEPIGRLRPALAAGAEEHREPHASVPILSAVIAGKTAPEPPQLRHNG